MSTDLRVQVATSKPECFVIMPISDPEGYAPGHFQHVFSDIFVPACEMAGFQAIRADQIKETNLIHLDVLQRLLSSPIVLCDLSSRNPNVLFELGLRQAFDKPVVLVQEYGTPRIFDIAPLRYTEYRQARIYHEVLEDQRAIASALTATSEAFNKGVGINSMVRILSLTKPARFIDIAEASKDPALQLIHAELSELRSEVQRTTAALASAPARLQADPASTTQEIKYLRELSREAERRLEGMRRTGEADTGVPELLMTIKALADRLSVATKLDGDWQQLAYVTSKIKSMEQEYLSLTGEPIWQSLDRRSAG